MASIDYKDAYYSIPVNGKHQKFLRFWWEGQKYQYVCLPNVLSNGPRDFTKVTKVLLRTLRKRGYTLTSYIDDHFSIEQEFQCCLENVIQAAIMSLDAGFVINWEKSILIPTQRMIYLGFILDTVEMKVRLTPEKISELKTIISRAIKSSDMSLLRLAQLVGKLE